MSLFDETAPVTLEAEGELSDPPTPGPAPASPITPQLPTSTSLDFRTRGSPLEPATPTFASSLHRPSSSASGSFDGLRKRPLAPAKMRKRSSEPGSAAFNDEPKGRIPTPRMSKSPTPADEDQFATLPERRRGSTAGSGSSQSSPLARTAFADQQQHLARRACLGLSLGNPPTTPPSTNPRSPHSSIDQTSYYPAPISPPPTDGATSPGQLSPGAISPFESPERVSYFRRDPSTFSADTGSIRSFVGEGAGGSHLLDLFGHERPLSTASSSSADQFQTLLRQAADLSRKLKDSEARFASSSNAYDAEHAELEARLDEARAELQQKRREEKELRSTEKQHLSQIRDLELEVSKLTKSLEGSRANFEGMRKSYQEQLAEAENLRSLVAETRRERVAVEDQLATQGGQVFQIEQDNKLLQDAIKRLEQDLLDAKKAQDDLDAQKAENLALKETIDRLKFDIDEIQQTSRKAAILAGGKAAEGMSVSRSLGRELAAQLADGAGSSTESEGEDEDEEEDEDVVVTTTRRIKKRAANLRKSLEPVHVERSVVVAEIAVQTDPLPTVATVSTDVQTNLSVSPAAELVEEPIQVVSVPFGTQTSAPQLEPVPTPQELKAKLAKDLGIDLEQLERFVSADSSEPAPPGYIESLPLTPSSGRKPSEGGVYLTRRVGRWASRFSPRAVSAAPSVLVNSFPTAAQPLVAQLVDTTMHFALYSITVYLSGVLTGSYFLSMTHHHHMHPLTTLLPHDTGSFTHLDSLALTVANTKGAWAADGTTGGQASGIIEGLQWVVNRLVWNGVRVHQRIPV